MNTQMDKDNFEIPLSKKAMTRLCQEAQVRNRPLEDHAYKVFAQKYEEMSEGEWSQHLKRQQRTQMRVDFSKLKRGRKCYRLKQKDSVCTELTWFTLPVQPFQVMEWGHWFKEEHIGKYYLILDVTNRKGMIGFNLKNEYEFYPTLKMLKKAVNRHFKKHGHSPYYKVGRRQS